MSSVVFKDIRNNLESLKYSHTKEVEEVNIPSKSMTHQSYIYDIDKSIRWNNEQREKTKTEIDIAYRKINQIKNRYRDMFIKDLNKEIANALGIQLYKAQVIVEQLPRLRANTSNYLDMICVSENIVEMMLIMNKKEKQRKGEVAYG